MFICRASICTFALAWIAVGATLAQNFPTKPPRIITAEAGGGADLVARILATELTANWKQQVIVDNRGRTAVETAVKAPPDGYSMLLFGSNVWLLQFLRDGVPWNALRDFSPVTIPDSSPLIVALHPSLEVNSVKELIALARNKPGVLNYASSSVGGTNHLATELFKSMVGINIVRVPYKGTGPAINGLIGGEVQLMFLSATGVTPHIKSGRLKAIAVTSAQPSALAPGLPTVAASGLPGFEASSSHGIFVPAGTPAAIVHLLNREIVKIVNQDKVKDKFLQAGVESVGNSPAQFAARIKHEMATLGKLIKDLGIHE